MNARFTDVAPIVLRDPLAQMLGSVEPGEPVRYTFEDAVKAAGYACPVVAGTWVALQTALRELYGRELPVRGEIEVTIGREAGRLARVTRIIALVTGAGHETGLGRFSGRYRREGLLRYDPNLAGWTRFRRLDTGAAADVQPSTELLLDSVAVQDLLAKVVRGQASEGERLTLASMWHDKIEHLLRTPQEVVRVRRVATAAGAQVLFEAPYAR